MNNTVIITALLILNLLDTFFTYVFVGNGIAVESNPIMRYLIDIDMMLFVTVKGLAVSILIIIVGIYNNNSKLIKISLLILLVVYFTITVIHMSEIQHMCETLGTIAQ